jgi:hypothetical protein
MSKRKGRKRGRRTAVTRGPARGSIPQNVPPKPYNKGSGAGSVEEPYASTGRGADTRTRKLSDRVMAALRNLGGTATKAQLLDYLGMQGRDSLRPALRYLVNGKRVGIDKSNGSYYKYFIIPAAVGHNQRLLEAGKIEPRTCKGTTKDGSPCKSPDLFVRESGYCANHDPKKGIRRGGRPPKMITMDTEFLKSPREAKIQNTNPYFSPHPRAIAWKPDSEKGTMTITLTREHMDLVYPEGAIDDNLRQVVLDFLAGNATMKDLKEAVE